MTMPNARSLMLPWIDAGHVSTVRMDEALRLSGVAPDTQQWLAFVRAVVLVLGSLCLAFSAVFFIAYNWTELGRYARFGLIEAGLLASVLLYWRLDSNGLPAKMTLTVSVALLGVLLAYFGQTYQTGADPWQLFATWAALMLPWALVGRFAPIWLIWIGLLNLALSLYFMTFFGLFGWLFASPDDLAWLLLALNTLAWVAWEALTPRYPWLGGRWPVRLIATASGVAMTLIVLQGIFESRVSPLLTLPAYAAWLTGVFTVYRARLPDLFMLAGACLTVIVTVTAQLGNWLMDSGGEAGAFLFLSVSVIGQAAAAATWLKRVHREQEA